MSETVTKIVRYLSAESMFKDDFGRSFTNEPGEVIYDAMTRMGPWATMTEKSFTIHSRGEIGIGRGQRYVRQSNGQLHKVGG